MTSNTNFGGNYYWTLNISETVQDIVKMEL